MRGQQSILCLVNKAEKSSPEKDPSHLRVVEVEGETCFPTFQGPNGVVVVAAFSLSPGDDGDVGCGCRGGAKSTKQEYIISQSVCQAAERGP